MAAFPIPSNENERLKEFQRLRFHEWGGSDALDKLCSVTARLLGTPISHVSLLDEDKQLFAGKIGLDVESTPREIAFCAHTIMTPAPFVVEDAENDPRFCRNPLVTESPKIRGYLGIPLETAPGLRIGALCAVSRTPRRFNQDDVQTLLDLSRIVVSVINQQRLSLEECEQLGNAIALQSEMLPSAAQIEEIKAACPLDLASFYVARDGIGGDIWGAEMIGDRRVMLYVADFTGHGVTAALNTARFHSFVHMTSRKADDPGSLLTHLNQKLGEVLPLGQFATMFCAVLDFKTNSMEYASAGAMPQLYRRSAEEPFELIAKPGVPLGLMRGVEYEWYTVPFQPGGALLLYTDALIETPRPPKSIFTAQSLKEYLNEATGTQDALQMCRNVMNKICSNKSVRLDDDLTLIVARHIGEDAASTRLFSYSQTAA